MTSNRCRSGRMTVLFVFLMAAIALFMGLSLNLSQVFQMRAHLQVCADAAAYSGAVQQARGLNRIARLNAQTVKTLKATRVALHGYLFPNYDAGNRTALMAEAAYRLYNRENLIRQEKINSDSAKNASQTVEEVTRRNEPEAMLASYTPLSGSMGRLIPATGEEARFGFFYKQTTPLGELILYAPGRTVKSLILRKDLALDTIYYSVQLKRPSFPWLFDWGLDSGAVADLRAYATAKPAGGSLWTGSSAEPHYATQLTRTGSVFPRPSIPDDWGYEW